MSVGFALNYFWSARIGFRIPTKNLIKMVAQVSISSAIMCVFVLYLKDFYILALVPLSALLYFAVLYILRGIDREDTLLLWQIVGRQQAVNTVKKTPNEVELCAKGHEKVVEMEQWGISLRNQHS
jgi:hypothetical protein